MRWGCRDAAGWRVYCLGRQARRHPGQPRRPYLQGPGLGRLSATGSAPGAVQRTARRPFAEARAFVHALGPEDQGRVAGLLPGRARGRRDIPAGPGRTYKDQGWAGERLARHRERRPQEPCVPPFEEARAFVARGSEEPGRVAGLHPVGREPADIPANPNLAYKRQGWAGMGDWLGTGTVAVRDRTYLPFEEARDIVRKLNLRGRTDWSAWGRSGARPADIPATPDHVYADTGWAGYGDWLGTGTPGPQDYVFLPFEQARAVVRRLGLKSSTEWTAWSKSGARPTNIPASPGLDLQGHGLGGHGRLARHRHGGPPEPRVPPVRAGARPRAPARAEGVRRLVCVAQDASPSRQHPCQPADGLQERRLDGLRRLAGHRHPGPPRPCLPAVRGGARRCAPTRPEGVRRLGGVAQDASPSRQHPC